MSDAADKLIPFVIVFNIIILNHNELLNGFHFSLHMIEKVFSLGYQCDVTSQVKEGDILVIYVDRLLHIFLWFSSFDW